MRREEIDGNKYCIYKFKRIVMRSRAKKLHGIQLPYYIFPLNICFTTSISL